MEDRHITHTLYIQPANVPDSRAILAAPAIASAMQQVQAWYRLQLGVGKTFQLNDPLVTVVKTPHPTDWYIHNPDGPDFSQYYWNNVLNDAYHLAGAAFLMEYDNWVIFADAASAKGQGMGGTSIGFTSGMAVLNLEDIDALLHQNPDRTYCREIGGIAHEVGHTFGLPHPEDPYRVNALMWQGFNDYPRCILNLSEQVQLGINPNFIKQPLKALPVGSCTFGSHTVRPRRPGRIRPPAPSKHT